MTHKKIKLFPLTCVNNLSIQNKVDVLRPVRGFLSLEEEKQHQNENKHAKKENKKQQKNKKKKVRFSYASSCIIGWLLCQ